MRTFRALFASATLVATVGRVEWHDVQVMAMVVFRAFMHWT
jgi:hypothetical protein